MLQDAILDTVQAMNAMQLSMSHSIAVTKLSMDSQEAAAEQFIQQMTPAAPLLNAGQFIDTYA